MKPNLKKKIKEVESLANKLESSKVIGLIDLTGLPSAQFQSIRAKVKDKFSIRVSKKPLIKRAIEKVKEKRKNLEKLESNLEGTIPALVFTNEDPFKMAKVFNDNKSQSLAKPGQISPKNISLEAGPTQFPPGPIIGELGQAGIKAAIEAGKVVIKEAKEIVTEGDEINQKQSDLLAKFNIRPMEIGLNLVAAYEGGYIYNKETLSIDETKNIEDIKAAYSQALNLAVFIAYPTKETTQILLQKAEREAKSISTLVPEKAPAEEKKEATPLKEEVKEPKEEEKEEKQLKATEKPKAEYTEAAAKQAQELINKLKDSKSGG